VNDLPILGKPVVLEIYVQEYNCTNKACSEKTFREQLPGFLGVKMIWTNRCQDFILSLASEMNCEAASVFCKRIGIKVSGDTIIRMLLRNTRKIPFLGEIIGVDDWAYRRGASYGTLICDGITHKPIALLPGREGKTFREWLQNNPQIKTVTRDRASAYSAAIKEVIPEARQIADRFHLFQNLLEAVKETVKRLLPWRIVVKSPAPSTLTGSGRHEIPERITESNNTNECKSMVIDEGPVPEWVTDNTVDLEACVADVESQASPPLYKEEGNRLHVTEVHRQAHEESLYEAAMKTEESEASNVYAADEEEQQVLPPLTPHEEDNRLLIIEVQRLSREECLSNTEIKNKVGISYRRIKRYLSGDANELCRDGRHGVARPSSLDQYSTVIQDMLAQRKSIKDIYHYLGSVGYTGAYSRLADYCAKNFKNRRKAASSKGCDHFIGRKSVLEHIWSDQPLDLDDKEYIFNKHPELTDLKDIVVGFQKTMNAKSVPKPERAQALNQWVDKILQSGFTALNSLGNGIKQDLDAVINSLCFYENNGFLEGNVNRLKAIKRNMFGRAKFPLLKAKVLRLCDYF